MPQIEITQSDKASTGEVQVVSPSDSIFTLIAYEAKKGEADTGELREIIGEFSDDGKTILPNIPPSGNEQRGWLDEIFQGIGGDNATYQG